MLGLSQDLGHDLREFFRDSGGRVSHRFDQRSNQNHLTADRNDEVEALWKSRQKNVGGRQELSLHCQLLHLIWC